MINGLSVIICCYNSENRIKTTLEYLDHQIVNDLPWELIVVDNNCTDSTVDVVQEFLKDSIQLNTRTKVINEANSGLNFARMKGVSVSVFDVVLFCDDDNWLNPQYVQKCFDFLIQNKEFGIVGGNGVPECEIVPPHWFEKLKGVYATGCRNDGEVTNVYGAGMAVLKSLLAELKFSLGDRRGNSLSSGGDSEMCFSVAKKGFKIRQLCKNTFKHFIPKERLTDDYILRMAKAYGETSAQLYLLENENPYKGVFYRFKTDLIFLSKKLFDFDFFNFKYEGIKKYYYWKTRFF